MNNYCVFPRPPFASPCENREDVEDEAKVNSKTEEVGTSQGCEERECDGTIG